MFGQSGERCGRLRSEKVVALEDDGSSPPGQA